jgi:hypothetical protein
MRSWERDLNGMAKDLNVQQWGVHINTNFDAVNDEQGGEDGRADNCRKIGKGIII